MYFKSLELIGFKSFAEKTRLNFEPGVTTIVGPNGCGKSNVADGIRWVLGEQSVKSLRASSMQDVIFNGTDTKEPINYAEVSLIFSNEKRILPIDYDEVTITRRVFRSGETEYLLNKTPVRLKDISELLMGTGIGTDNYAIIEQGKMDLVLSSKPEDRRYIFEEASGITKYKSKKKEALRKLEQTEQNLLRINDIIQEVKRQISSIERQARKAEKYKIDFEKLKDLESKLSFSEFKSLRTQEKTYSVENEDLKTSQKDLSALLASAGSAISNYRQSLDEMNYKISESRNRCTEMSGSLEMNSHKVEINKERIEEASANQDGLKKELESISDKMENAKKAIAKLKADLENINSERSGRQKSLEEKELLINTISKDIDDIELNVKTCKVEIVDYLSKETRIKNDLIKLGADVQNRKARQRRLNIEKETVLKELDGVEKSRQKDMDDFKNVEVRALAIKSDLESKKNLNDQVLNEMKALTDNIAKEENRKASLKSKIEILEDNIKRHEGYKTGVKGLLAKLEEDRSNFSGILGVLADIVKVKRGYEEAVDTFLGDDAQLVVAQKDSDINKFIDYLKKNNLGKVNFISIETLNRIDRKRRAKDESGIKDLVPLKDFINMNSAYDVIAEHFFKDAYLAESVVEEDIARFAAAGDKTIVTRGGFKFNDGKIFGGSVSETAESSLVGRREKLEYLKEEFEGLDGRVASLAKLYKEKSDTNKSLTLDIASLEEDFHKEDIVLSNIKIKLDGHEQNIKKMKEELALLDLELEDANQTIEELSKKGKALNLELNSIEKEKSLKQTFIDESQLTASDKRAEKERLTIEITTLRAQAQSLESSEENVKSNLKNQEAGLFELEDALYSKEETLKESIDKKSFLKNEITILSAQNETIAKDLKILNEELFALEKAKSDINDKLSIGELQLKEKERDLESLRNEIRDLDIKLTEINYKKTNLKERISQAYKVNLEDLHVELEENADWDAMRQEIAELKDKLEKMGPVNLVAIEEHKELEERHVFLVHQQEDLVNAKDSLRKAIQKINKTTKELFLDAFQKIQVEFKNFFRLLFGGGQAELVLIDEQDILESGIEIIVRPPGKKLQNIMLLSGGEKALTAIALLFSVFKVRPSPFCVLDEIDAPLDESNINRFSNVLKDFLKMSQFIIITHNKRTIELADVMYGITMQERGVSKIVSVKFLDEAKKVLEEEKADAIAS